MRRNFDSHALLRLVEFVIFIWILSAGALLPDALYAQEIQPLQSKSDKPDFIANIDRADLIAQRDALLGRREPDADSISLPLMTYDPRVRVLELTAKERELNRELTLGYRHAQTLAVDAAVNDMIVSVSLRHWHVLVRRMVDASLHTEVPELVADPDCVGDLLGDAVLLRYFDGILPASRTIDQSQIVGTLAELARQSACLSARQSALLAAAYTGAYDELAQFLRANGRADVLPAVSSALFTPLLITYDVEKRRGKNSPLAVWFSRQEPELAGAALDNRLPAAWHGLWLYDWRSGRLLGFKNQRRPKSENDVDLIRFIHSIAQIENLGDDACPFADMVLRGADAIGYACDGRRCTTPQKRGPGPLQTLASQPAFGAALFGEEADQQGCDRQSGNGSGGGTGQLCGAITQAGEMSRASKLIGCLSQQLVRPGTEGMACFGERTGWCSNPIGQLTKDLQQSAMAGVKMTKGCSLSAGGPNMASYNMAALNALDKYQKERERIAEQAELAVTFTVELARETISQADAAMQKQLSQTTDPAKQARAITDRNNIAEAAIKARDAALAGIRDQQKKQTEAAKKTYEQELQEAAGANGVASEGSGTESGTAVAYCRPELGNCDTTSCSAMAESTKRTMSCLKRVYSAAEQNPLGTGTGQCDPKVCDDFDAGKPATGAGQACFAGMVNGTQLATNRQCWAIQCAPGFEAAGGTGNACGCRQQGGPGGGAGGMADACAAVRCESGAPIVSLGGCRCSGDDPSPQLSAGIGGFDLGPIPGPGTLAVNVFFDNGSGLGLR